MLIEKVKGELKREGLTAHQLSERLGEQEEKIREGIEILQKKDLIQESGMFQESQEVYIFKSFIWTKIGFSSLILLHVILTVITMLLIMNIEGTFTNYVQVRPN